MTTQNLGRFTTALALAAALAAASPAKAFRMLRVSGTGRFTSGSVVSCDSAGGFAHRNSGIFLWYLNTANQGAGKDNNITPAMNTWNGVSGNPYLNYYAGTTTDGFATDGRNTMLWEAGGSCTGNCLALTAIVVQARQVIIESDITFNNLVTWRTDTLDYDVQAVATHELGHSMGIHHSELINANPKPTMVAAYFGALARTLESDDRQAIACSVNWYVSPIFDSFHESTRCADSTGWVWNSKVPNGDVSVEIWADSYLLTTVPASICRADLAGKGDGCHGFSFGPGSRALVNDGSEWIIRAKNALTGEDLNGTGHSLYCAARLFTTLTPTDFLDHAPTSYTVGNEFSSSRDGLITRLRYYRAPNETGVHTLKLYTAAGTFLTSKDVDFGPDLVARWEEGWLSSPVAITANTRYVVTVTTQVQQSKTYCGLSTPITRGPLTAWGGRWIEGVSFPITTSCSNFWTDVFFDQ